VQMAKFFGVVVLGAALAACASGSAGRGGSGAGDGAYGENGAYANGAGSHGGFVDVSAYANRSDLRQYHTIYFDYNSPEIRAWGLKPINANTQHEMNPQPQSMEVIHAYAAYLLQHPGTKVRLEGNTDARGSREYNVALGERRGNSVADVLKMDGVSAQQIDVISYGKERPAALGTSESAYCQNRRVEIKFERG